MRKKKKVTVDVYAKDILAKKFTLVVSRVSLLKAFDMQSDPYFLQFFSDFQIVFHNVNYKP